MEQTKLDEILLDLNEMKCFLEQATRQRVKDIIAIEVRKLETEEIQLRETINTTPIENVTKTILTTPKRYEVELTNYAWDQSDKFVKLFISLEGVQAVAEEDVTVEFTNRSINLYVKGLNNKDYKLVVINLLENIDVSKSYRKIKTDMVSIYAKKVKEASKWSHLTIIEKRIQDIKSDKIGTINNLEEDASSESGLFNIMKKMYESGDNEMKRMISKAWTEGEEKKRERGMDI